jgi:hypothetical protein
MEHIKQINSLRGCEGMKKTFSLSLILVTLAMSVAGAEIHRITLFQPSVVNGSELKAGHYKLEYSDRKATLSHGKNVIEAAVRIETVNEKFASTSVRYRNSDGKYYVSEIRIGGTKTKLIFD